MPKQTFLNLPEEKRKMILACAVDEFAEYGYEKACISRMVANAGIAKGSFYQYFEDKEDLYVYVLDAAIVKRKLSIMDKESERLAEINFTEFFRLMCKTAMSEFLDRPKLVKISADFWRNQHNPVCQRILEKYKYLKNDYFKSYIDFEKKRGEIDANVDTEVLNSLIMGMGNQVVNEIITNGYEAITAEYIDGLTDKIEYILTNGIYKGVKPKE